MTAADGRPRASRDPVLLTLWLAGAAAIAFTGFVALAPNRLVSGLPVMLWHAAAPASVAVIAALAAVLLACGLARASPAVHAIAGVAAAALLLVLLATAGAAAARLGAGASALARVSAGAGFWIAAGCAALAIVDAAQRLGAGARWQAALVVALAAAVAAIVWGGRLDALTLAREYAGHRSAFAAALLRHIVLVAASVGPALAIGVPLGIAVLRRPAWRGPVFAVLNLLQTIPSIALFGLLLVPLAEIATAWPGLAALGIGGVGMAPALIALTLYALLPVVRGTVAGIGGVDPAVIDAGAGMGLTRHQLLWRVELPLAAPVLLAGLRIVTVQAIGLAVVAALIGAGGLGTFVFAGLGQYAVGLVLLGTIPAILLALAADFVLSLAAAAIADD